MVLWLKDLGEQSLLVLGPTGKNQAAPPHHTLIVVDKEAKGTPPTWITSSFKGITCRFQVNLCVRHEVQDLFWGVEVEIDAVYYESYVDIGDLLVLVICLNDKEYGCHPTELRGALHCRRHKHTLCNELPQVVQGNALHVKGALDGPEANVPQVETILAVESVPRYRTLTHELEEYLAEVECGHLEEQAESLLQEGAVRYTWLKCTKERLSINLP